MVEVSLPFEFAPSEWVRPQFFEFDRKIDQVRPKSGRKDEMVILTRWRKAGVCCTTKNVMDHKIHVVFFFCWYHKDTTVQPVFSLYLENKMHWNVPQFLSEVSCAVSSTQCCVSATTDERSAWVTWFILMATGLSVAFGVLGFVFIGQKDSGIIRTVLRWFVEAARASTDINGKLYSVVRA